MKKHNVFKQSNNTTSKFDCITIHSNQRRLNFVCKSYENGCTWSLGASNSKRHKKWIIKSIRGHHTCLVPMSSTTRQTRHSTNHPTNCQNKLNCLHEDIDCKDQNVHELYLILQKDMVSKVKSVGDDSWKLGRIICQAAKTFGSFAILCSRDCDRCSNKIYA